MYVYVGLSPQPRQPAQRGGLCFGVVDVHSTCCLPQPNFSYDSSVLAEGGTGCGGKWDIDRLISIIDVRVARQFFFGLHSTPTSSTSIAPVLCCLWVWFVPFLWPTDWMTGWVTTPPLSYTVIMYYYRLFVYALVLLSLITVLISLSQGFYRYACSDKLLSGDNNEVEFRLSLEFAVAFENVCACVLGRGFFNNFRKELCTYDIEDE